MTVVFAWMSIMMIIHRVGLKCSICLSDERIISTPNSKVKVYIVPTNEEVMIARDVIRLTK